MIKAYMHMNGMTRISDPEEKELADGFDKEFTEVFKAVPKANRKALLNMVSVIYDLNCFHSLRGYIAGLK